MSHVRVTSLQHRTGFGLVGYAARLIGHREFGRRAYLSSTEVAKYKPIFKRRVFYDSYMEVLDYAKPFVWGFAEAIGFLAYVANCARRVSLDSLGGLAISSQLFSLYHLPPKRQ